MISRRAATAPPRRPRRPGTPANPASAPWPPRSQPLVPRLVPRFRRATSVAVPRLTSIPHGCRTGRCRARRCRVYRACRCRLPRCRVCPHSNRRDTREAHRIRTRCRLRGHRVPRPRGRSLCRLNRPMRHRSSTWTGRPCTLPLLLRTAARTARPSRCRPTTCRGVHPPACGRRPAPHGAQRDCRSTRPRSSRARTRSFSMTSSSTRLRARKLRLPGGEIFPWLWLTTSW